MTRERSLQVKDSQLTNSKQTVPHCKELDSAKF